MHRNRFLSLTFALVLLLSISLVQSASSAGPPSCLVSNERTDQGFRSLQAAIDAAASGDTLTVKGTCVGSSLIGGAPGSVTDKSLTLQGVSNKTFGVATLDGGGSSDAVLELVSYGGPTVTINDLTIRNGGYGINCSQEAVNLTRTTVADNARYGVYAQDVPCSFALTDSTVSGNGGGIYVGRGSWRLVRSSVRDNRGSGMVGSGWLTDSTVSGNGGFGIGTSNVVDLTHSTVSGNGGGGIAVGSSFREGPGRAIINSSTISDNKGPGLGVGDAWVSLIGSTVSGNSTSGSGGGINADTSGGRVEISDSTVSGNTAAVDGGGINVLSSDVSITRSTVSGNAAGRYGGGISVGSGGVDYAGWLSLEDSTVSGNTASSGGGIYVDVSSSDNISLTGTNIFTDNVPEDCVGVAGC